MIQKIIATKYAILAIRKYFSHVSSPSWTGCLDDMVECRMTDSAHVGFYVAAQYNTVVTIIALYMVTNIALW